MIIIITIIVVVVVVVAVVDRVDGRLVHGALDEARGAVLASGGPPLLLVMLSSYCQH